TFFDRGHVGIDGSYNFARTDRNAFRWKVLAETDAGLFGAIDKAFEMIHGAGRQVVQNQQAPWLRGTLCQSAVSPAVGIVPVARDRVPEHAAMLVAREIFDDGRL